MISRRVITNTLTVANLCLFVIYSSGWINASAPDKKTIIRRLTLSKEPVEISLNLKGQPVKASEAVHAEAGIRAQEFEADSDWLKDLTLKLRNTSGKTITYLVLILDFPEITKNGRTAEHQIFLGVDPDRKFQRPELRLMPNETIEVPLSARYDDIKTLVETVGNLSPESVSNVLVDVHAAFFDDGTFFEAGTLFRRNPDQNDLRKWIKIDNP